MKPHTTSRRPRRAVQLSLGRARKPCGRGGWRPGAGRPRRQGTCSHTPRERFTAREPVHVTLRLIEGVPSLRQHAPFQIVRAAIAAVADATKRGLPSACAAIRIIEYTVQSNHVHLIVRPTAPKPSLAA